MARDLSVLLSFVDVGCLCESYYSYKCPMCAAMADGTMAKLVDDGITEYVGGYSPYRLTEKGRVMLEVSRG